MMRYLGVTKDTLNNTCRRWNLLEMVDITEVNTLKGLRIIYAVVHETEKRISFEAQYGNIPVPCSYSKIKSAV